MITLKLLFATSPHTMANNTGLKINSNAVWNARNRFIAYTLSFYTTLVMFTKCKWCNNDVNK